MSWIQHSKQQFLTFSSNIFPIRNKMNFLAQHLLILCWKYLHSSQLSSPKNISGIQKCQQQSRGTHTSEALSFRLPHISPTIFPLSRVIFFAPQIYFINTNNFDSSTRVDNNKERKRSRGCVFSLLPSVTFCAKTNFSPFYARAGWNRAKTDLEQRLSVPCLLYLIQTPYREFWDCSV